MKYRCFICIHMNKTHCLMMRSNLQYLITHINQELGSFGQLTFFCTQVMPPKKEGTQNFRFPGTFLTAV